MKTRNIILETEVRNNLIQEKKTNLINWMSEENAFFTKFMEESITNKQMLLISQATIAFTILVSSAFATPLAAVICLIWFITSIYQCVKGGLK